MDTARKHRSQTHRPGKRALGRDELKPWRGVKDGSPQAELDFKFYRQATNKIGGISEGVVRFLESFFKSHMLPRDANHEAQRIGPISVGKQRV
jgi:hypothetical protein